MFIYCFDKQEKNKLEKQFQLFKESNIGNKQCWIFLMNNNSNFSAIDQSKCVISNRMNF